MHTSASNLSIESLEQIGAICEAFETECQNDVDSVQIEPFLAQIEPAVQPHLLVELILLKTDYQLKNGEWPNQQAYLAQFPDWSEAVSQAFSKIAESTQSSEGRLPELGRRFQVLECLGSGGMGTVYRARDVKLGRDVAIKTLKKTSVELDQRFEREIRLTAALMHPNIISLFDFLEHRGTKFAVLELAEGSTLRHRLQSNSNFQLDTAEATQVALGVARALQAAHRMGIIHRDIKPENVVAGPDGQIKVLDFGLARLTAAHTDLSLTKTEVNIGTFPYMSPEQVTNKELSCATDIFSLGIVLLEMLAGKNPFLGKTIAETSHKIAKVDPTTLPEFKAVPAGAFQKLIVAMLSPIPEARPSAAQTVEFLTQLSNPSTADSSGSSLLVNAPSQHSRVPTNLPQRSQSLVGRGAQLSEVCNWIQNSPLTTIVGTGGTGKTSLAYQAARQSQSHFPGGVWLCELATLPADGDVTQALVATLDKTEGNARDINTIIAQLQNQQVLILLDNCEHVVQSAAELAQQLMDYLPQLTILATSRRPLDLPTEHVYFLSGLETQALDGDAVELFVKCAQSKAGYVDAAENGDLVQQIVSRLEGLPLLIELAAPRLKSMTLEDLLAGLSDQLSALQVRRVSDNRQATVGKMIEWSFNLLSEAEQAFLLDLSVFRGSFSLAAAASISEVSNVGQLMDGLIDHSVVSQTRSHRTRAQDATRFRLLEPIRQFCEARISPVARESVLERHARHFAARMAQIRVIAQGCEEADAAHELNECWADLRAAVHWGIERKVPEVAIDSICELDRIMLYQSRVEAFDWLNAAEQAMPEAFESRPKALATIGVGYWVQSDLDSVRKYADQSEKIKQSSHAQIIQASAAYMVRDFEKAAERYLFAMELAQQQGDLAEIRFCRIPIAAIAKARIDPHDPEIERLIEDSKSEVLKSRWPTGMVWHNLVQAQIEIFRGNVAHARLLLDQVILSAEECGCLWLRMWAIVMQSNIDSTTPTSDTLIECIDRLQTLNDSHMVVQMPAGLRNLILQLIALGMDELAAKCIPLADRLVGGGSQSEYHPNFPAEVANLKQRLGEQTYQSLQTVGETLTVERVVALAKQSVAGMIEY